METIPSYWNSLSPNERSHCIRLYISLVFPIYTYFTFYILTLFDSLIRITNSDFCFRVMAFLNHDFESGMINLLLDSFSFYLWAAVLGLTALLSLTSVCFALHENLNPIDAQFKCLSLILQKGYLERTDLRWNIFSLRWREYVEYEYCLTIFPVSFQTASFNLAELIPELSYGYPAFPSSLLLWLTPEI
jgi:hypothetical protein